MSLWKLHDLLNTHFKLFYTQAKLYFNSSEHLSCFLCSHATLQFSMLDVFVSLSYEFQLGALFSGGNVWVFELRIVFFLLCVINKSCKYLPFHISQAMRIIAFLPGKTDIIFILCNQMQCSFIFYHILDLAPYLSA